MNYYLNIHFTLIIICMSVGLLFSGKRTLLIFIIFPGIFIMFSAPFFLLLCCFIEKFHKRSEETRYDIIVFPEENAIKKIDDDLKIDNDLLFYSYREKIFPENHALYFLKNLGRKNDIESQIISSSTISHKEENLLKNINSQEERYKKERNLKNLIALGNAYFNYCYFGYATPVLRKSYVRKACTYILEYIEDKNEVFPELYYLLGRLYLIERMYKEAEMWFGKLMVTGTPNPVILSYVAEIFFYKGEYSKMMDIIRWISQERDLNEKLKEVAQFWIPVE